MNIVADGPQRHRDASDYWAVRKRIRDEIALRYESQRKHASTWRRLWIEFTIRREVSAELRKIFPPGALHLMRFAER